MDFTLSGLLEVFIEFTTNNMVIEGDGPQPNNCCRSLKYGANRSEYSNFNNPPSRVNGLSSSMLLLTFRCSRGEFDDIRDATTQ